MHLLSLSYPVYGRLFKMQGVCSLYLIIQYRKKNRNKNVQKSQHKYHIKNKKRLALWQSIPLYPCIRFAKDTSLWTFNIQILHKA